jgi:hypothetical protein
MKNAVFWDVPTCGTCKNRLFGAQKVFLRSVLQLLVSDNIFPMSLILFAMMMGL